MKDSDYRDKPEKNPDLNGEIQRSLVLFKPDAVQRGVVGEILTRFERLGLKIIGVKMVEPDEDHYYKHYEDISKLITRRGQDAFEVTLEYMALGPVIAMVFEGVEAVPVIRKIVGTTEPQAAQPGTIRGDYAHISFGYANPRNKSIPNLIHASGNLEEAEQEISMWFKKEELFDYEDLSDKYTR
ncbi:MAG: nucleoside-diphosphate kinase [Candidatus Nanosyncoccaceae bacterium]|jgi:nucleoside-diphosphate kinase